MRHRLVHTCCLLAFTGLAGLVGLLGTLHPVHATEGGASYYFPGAFASFGVALAPEPGFLVADQVLLYDATLDRAVLQGRVNASLDTFAMFNLLTALYTFPQSVLGARLQVGGFLPFGYIDLEAEISAAGQSWRRPISSSAKAR
jgi:hypothetical protein